jgi:hypothetical protein
MRKILCAVRHAHIGLLVMAVLVLAMVRMLWARNRWRGHARQAQRSKRERRQLVQNNTPASGTCNARPRRARQASSPGSWSLSTGIGNMLGANPMALSDAIIATYMTIHMARPPSSIDV